MKNIAGLSKNEPQESEIQLLSKIRSGDNNAFVFLAANYRNRITSIASTFGLCESERDDMVQEGYIALYKAALSYNSNMASFSTFANVCIRNRMINWVVKNSSSTAQYLSLSSLDEQTLIEISTVQDGVESAVIRKTEIDRIVATARSVLSPKEFSVFSHYCKGYSNKEICSILSIDKKSCENTLFRIRNKLKALK